MSPPSDTFPSRIQVSELAVRLAPQFLEWCSEFAEEAAFYSRALPQMQSSLPSDYIAVVRAERGIWRTEGEAGRSTSLPLKLLDQRQNGGGPVFTRG